ncbi:hypothetical protein ElyMa_005693300 [Elysia marginata]|uniref:Uncharacterized protein n=1 Tax=Elysia marginata TaxID=1093978 RepID=A0AAV4FGH7_9GAST|nr:hypothetical protein ElyMa_005693300 [Elysia marginata]
MEFSSLSHRAPTRSSHHYIFLTGLLDGILITIYFSQGSYTEWRVVWYLLTGFLVLISAAFLVLGQAKLQPWASTQSHETEKQQKDKLLES